MAYEILRSYGNVLKRLATKDTESVVRYCVNDMADTVVKEIKIYRVNKTKNSYVGYLHKDGNTYHFYNPKGVERYCFTLR